MQFRRTLYERKIAVYMSLVRRSSQEISLAFYSSKSLLYRSQSSSSLASVNFRRILGHVSKTTLACLASSLTKWPADVDLMSWRLKPIECRCQLTGGYTGRYRMLDIDTYVNSTRWSMAPFTAMWKEREWHF
jgi:hypothetical protein